MISSKYTIEFDPKNEKDLRIFAIETSKHLYNLSYILGNLDTSNDEELLDSVEGVLSGHPLQIKYQVQNDFCVDVSHDYTKVINGNLEDEEKSIDILPTRELSEIIKELIQLKKHK